MGFWVFMTQERLILMRVVVFFSPFSFRRWERKKEKEKKSEKETLSIYYLVLDKGKGFRASRTFPILRSFYASRPLGQTPVP